MKRVAVPILVSLIATQAVVANEPGMWSDPQGDAVTRRTDQGNNAPLPAGFEPIDLLSVSVQGWMPTVPTGNLYTGTVILGEADFVRIRIVLDGLVHPSGPIGLNGFPYNPTIYGDRPITGFIDLDIDDQKDSGGELMPVAQNRYLANVARFGNSPQDSISERMVQSPEDLNSAFYSEPQFERSGAEFTLIMCGCFSPVLLTQDGDMDSMFDAGETWILLGQYFERFESFAPESGLFGGVDFGLFNPPTYMQFAHDIPLDQTTITLVYPITNAGAALQAGQAEQPIDLDLTNHTSMEEAIDDLIFGADFATGPLGVLTNDWKNEEFNEYREPTSWKVTALIGTAPTSPQPASFYIWTDTGFDELHGDLNLDELNDSNDVHVLEDFINDTDGTVDDPDQTVNGEIGIENFGLRFHFFDLNYDGIISDDDTPETPCIADFTGDGVLDFFDVSSFLGAFASQLPSADINSDGIFNFFDISLFLSAFAAGCP